MCDNNELSHKSCNSMVEQSFKLQFSKYQNQHLSWIILKNQTTIMSSRFHYGTLVDFTLGLTRFEVS
jgi:hypothetical protein